MVPTVGRVVHYTNLGDADGKYPPEQQAAIITKVTKRAGANHYDAPPREEDYKVSLHIFYETGDFHMTDVPFNPVYERGHWTWPAHV